MLIGRLFSSGTPVTELWALSLYSPAALNWRPVQVAMPLLNVRFTSDCDEYVETSALLSPVEVTADRVTLDVLSTVMTLPKASRSATLVVPRVRFFLPEIDCDWKARLAGPLT